MRRVPCTGNAAKATVLGTSSGWALADRLAAHEFYGCTIVRVEGRRILLDSESITRETVSAYTGLLPCSHRSLLVTPTIAKHKNYHGL
jgi:hypothetical protein